MSKAIRSFPKEDQAKVVARRIAGDQGGIGTLAAKGWKAWKSAQDAEAKEAKEFEAIGQGN